MATQFAFGKIVTNGLVLSLDAADRNSYPGSGTAWRDLSGNGNNGTLTNGPTYDSGNGGSIVFDGVNDAVSLPNINTSTGKTYILWLKNTSTVATLRFAYAHRNPDRVYIGVDGTNLYLRVGSDASFIGGTTLTSGQWFNLAIRINTNIQYEGFVNGVSVGVRPTTLSTSTGTGIGAFFDNTNSPAGNYWIGNVATAQVYNIALSDTEVLQNYNAQKSRFGL